MILYAKSDIFALYDLAYNKQKEDIMAELARSPEQIGNAIRRARIQLKLTQSELGEKAGLRQGTISLIESGNPASRLDTLLAVLSALNLELQVAPRSKLRIEDLLGITK